MQCSGSAHASLNSSILTRQAAPCKRHPACDTLQRHQQASSKAHAANSSIFKRPCGGTLQGHPLQQHRRLACPLQSAHTSLKAAPSSNLQHSKAHTTLKQHPAAHQHARSKGFDSSTLKVQRHHAAPADPLQSATDQHPAAAFQYARSKAQTRRSDRHALQQHPSMPAPKRTQHCDSSTLQRDPAAARSKAHTPLTAALHALSKAHTPQHPQAAPCSGTLQLHPCMPESSNQHLAANRKQHSDTSTLKQHRTSMPAPNRTHHSDSSSGGPCRGPLQNVDMQVLLYLK